VTSHSPQQHNAPQLSSRIERILAYMVAALVGLSVLAFVAVLIGTASGVGANDGFSQGGWPIILVLPLIALPLGFLLLIALLVTSGVRRGHEARTNRL
jgi:FtsH-binding integral membrane protein